MAAMPPDAADSRHRHFVLAKLAIMAKDAGMDFSGIIDSLGGNSELARELGEAPRTVWRWRERGIPARYWHRIVELAEKKGVEGVSMDKVQRPLWQRAPTEAPAP